MPPISPVLLSDARTLAAYLIFFGSYFVFALGKFPWMKIDRTGAAIIGAVLMVAFRIVGPQEALRSIDFATIVLLFSMMLVVANLRVGGFFERIAEWAIEQLRPHHLLPTVIFTTGFLSAFLVNDIVCLVMTPFVLHMARRLSVPAMPYVIAVATASNIGSVATITGNPQNMLIGSLSGITYPEFIAHLGPVALAGLCANWLLIHWMCLRGPIDRVSVAQALSAPEFQYTRCQFSRPACRLADARPRIDAGRQSHDYRLDCQYHRRRAGRPRRRPRWFRRLLPNRPAGHGGDTGPRLDLARGLAVVWRLIQGFR
jgi:hypothetical protein